MIEIFLPENAGTGYRWSVDDLDRSLFDVAGASDEYPGQTIGAGGQASSESQYAAGESALCGSPTAGPGKAPMLP